MEGFNSDYIKKTKNHYIRILFVNKFILNAIQSNVYLSTALIKVYYMQLK